MSKNALLHFRPLGSGDARLIQRLQHRLFARQFRESLTEIAGILRNTEEHMVCNLSFGLFDGERMVGYVFAYVETESVFYGRPEEIVYLKEIGLRPGYESSLRSLFSKLYDLWHAFTPGMPMEAHVMPETLEEWRRLVRLVRHFGLTLTDTGEVSQAGRPPYRLLRLDVDPATVELAEIPRALPGNGWRAGNGITVTVVSDQRQWLALKESWNALLEQTADGNVFQSFEYLWQWWKHYGFWSALRVFVLREGDTVVGVVPMMQEHFSVLGRTVRKLVFITTPMDMNRPKFLFGRDRGRCTSAFLGWLEQHAGEWDILDIDEQGHGDGTLGLWRHFRTDGCLVAESETLCPYIDLKGSWESFLSSRSRKMRSNINRSRRKLSENGELVLRRVSTMPDLEAAMDVHCEIESRSWKLRRNLDLASDKSRYFFHRSLARIFGKTREFEMRILELDGRPIASTYGIARGDVFQSLKIAHDSDFDRYSPGTVLESFELQDLFSSRFRCYELMGSFLTNKLRWTTTVHKTVNLHVYRRQPRLLIYFWTYFVFKRQVKAILKRTGQLERVDRLLKKLSDNPFPSY